MKNKILYAFLMLFLFFPATILAQSETASNTNENTDFSIYGYSLFYMSGKLIETNGEITNAALGIVSYSRLKMDFTPDDIIQFHVEFYYAGYFGNLNMYSLFERLGLGVLNPINQSDYLTTDFNQSLVLDHIWFSVNLGSLDIQAGKIPIGWGSGYVFNPTSRTQYNLMFNSIIEETEGTVAFVPSLAIDQNFAITLYVAFQDKTHKKTALASDQYFENLPLGFKTQIFTESFDISVSLIKEVIYVDPDYTSNYYLGLDLVGSMWDFGVYLEAVLLLPQINGEISFEGSEFDEITEFCIGFDYMIPDIDVQIRTEYYHQGTGESNTSLYNITNVFSGAKSVLAENYLVAIFDREFISTYKIRLASIFNLDDGSFAMLPEFTLFVGDNTEIVTGAFLFFGDPGTEFNGEFTIPVSPTTFDLTETSIYFKVKVSF